MKEKELHNFFKNFFVVSLSTSVTRAIIYSNYILFSHTPKIVSSVAQASVTFHHYMLGFVLIFLGLVAKKNKFATSAIFIGLGIVLEEWTVLIENVGAHSPIRYFSAFDVPAGLLIFALCYWIIFAILQNNGNGQRKIS